MVLMSWSVISYSRSSIVTASEPQKKKNQTTKTTTNHHSCRAGLFFPPRKVKISMHGSQQARDFKNHHRPSGLHAFNIRSSVLTTAEYKTAATFLPNVYFHEAVAKPVV